MKKGDIWFMGYSANKIWRNFFSVVAGVLIALVIIFPIGLIAGLLSFSDSRIPKAQEVFSDALLIGGAVLGCIISGYYTAKISTRKDIVHGICSGIVLTLLYALVNDFKFNLRYPDIGIAYFGIIPAVLIGVFIGIKKKKIISNNIASLSDTPSQ